MRRWPTEVQGARGRRRGVTAVTPSGAPPAFASLKELAGLADLAARHGWRLNRDHAVDNEIAWERTDHRVVVTLTAAARIRQCGFGYPAEQDALETDWSYDSAGALEPPGAASSSLKTMLFWERRDADAAGLPGMVRRWFTAPQGIGAGDLILFDGPRVGRQWCPVIAVAAGHVTALVERAGRVLRSSVGRYEIESHRYAHPGDELRSEIEGRWLVISQGSTHLWDLDAGTYARIPGPGRSGGYPHDGRPMPITRVDRWPVVGSTSLVWYDDPNSPLTREHWRQSSIIASITGIPPGSPATITR